MKNCFLFIWRLHWVRKGNEGEAVDSFFLLLIFSIFSFSSYATQKKTGCMDAWGGE